MEGFLFLIPVLLVIVLLFWFAAGGMDHGRIKQYVEQRGGKMLDSHWSPLGPGWFGAKSDRIYGVHYLARDGNEHEAHCKTSLLAGVYFTEDRIVKYARQPISPSQLAESLEAKSQRLREELERLKRERPG